LLETIVEAEDRSLFLLLFVSFLQKIWKKKGMVDIKTFRKTKKPSIFSMKRCNYFIG